MSDKVAQIIPFMYPYKIGTPAKMLFDVPRNRYYDTILMQCRDQICADIGFGTGILTAIALYYGAKHVYAYEEDPGTFAMGKEMLESMGFGNRVTCLNEKYKPGKTKETIAFHEIVDSNLWREGIAESLRSVKHHGITLLPGRVYCKIHYMPMSNKLIKEKDAIELTGLSYMDKIYLKALKKSITSDKFTSYDNYADDELESKMQVGSYMIDLNKDEIPRYIKQEIDISIPKDSLIFCEYYLGEFRLNDGCWRRDKAVHVHEKGFYTFIQDTIDGSWWLE